MIVHKSYRPPACLLALLVATAWTASCKDSSPGTDRDGGTPEDARICADGAPIPDAGPDPFDPADHICSEDNWCWTHPTPAGASLLAGWMDDTGRTVLVGEGGTAMMDEGTGFESMTCGLGHENLYGLWGPSVTELIAVGEVGAAYRYDGSCWAKLDTGLTFQELVGVWGTAPDNVYAAGREVIVRYNGTNWSNETPLADGICLTSVWGSADDNIYAGGWLSAGWERAPILHYDGNGWSYLNAAPVWVESIWGSDATDVYFAGNDGLDHFDGTDLTRVISDNPMYGVWGTGPDDVFAVGRQIVHFDGNDWTVEADPSSSLFSVAGSGSHSPVAAGALGLIFRRQAGSWLPEQTRVADALLQAVWGSGFDDVYAVGMDGVILHYNGTDWSVMDSGVTWTLTSIWGTGPDNVYAAGWDASLLHYDGLTWNRIPADAFWGRWVTALWGTDDDDMLAAVEDTVFRYNGTGWSEEISNTEGHIRAIWGTDPCNVFAVGDGGVILHYDGSGWTEMESPTTYQLHGLHGSSPDNVYAVGLESVILHYNGDRWAAVSGLPNYGSFRAVWTSGPADVYVAGPRGIILHFDGNEWIQMLNPGRAGIRAMWGHGPGAVFAVGSSGAVLRHTRSQ